MMIHSRQRHTIKSLQRKIWIWTGVLLVQILFFQVLTASPSAMDGFHHLWQMKRNGHILLFSGFSFSAGDIFYLILAVLAIREIIGIFRLNTRLKSLFTLLIGLNFGYPVYFILWGNLYTTPPLTEKMPPLPKKNLERIMAEALRQKIIEANAMRAQLADETDKLNESSIVRRTASVVQSASAHLPLSPAQPLPGAVSVKNGLLGKWQAYTGISGYYNPFTAEATVNFSQPKTALAFTTAHEMAHQMGFARESEASFIGYLIGQQSSDPLVRYSTDLFAIELLLYNLGQQDKPLAKKLKAALSSEIKEDLAKEKLFYTQHTGWISDIFGWANDLFLKSNRQRGTLSYNDALTLVLQEYEAHKKGPYLMIRPQKHK